MKKSKKKKHKKDKARVPAVVSNSESIGRILEWSDKLMVYHVGQMAKRGGEILGELRASLGCEPSSGHIVDAMMNAAAEMERSAVEGHADRYVDALTVTLFLARDLSVRQGKIQPTVPSEQLS